MTHTTRSSGSGSPWEIERLNIPAYLKRIDYHGDTSPTVETLRAVHRAHVEHIPFENIDIALGRRVGLALDALQAKLIARARGGYCYEHNLLFAALLERLGYRVTRLMARLYRGSEEPGARTHMALQVHIDENSWLADVGFGGGILEPLALHAGTTAQQGSWRYRLVGERQGAWTLHWERPSQSDPLYEFTLEPQHPGDYAIANYFTSTHPDSPFIRRVVALGTGPGARQSIVGGDLRTLHADGRVERRPVKGGELDDLLRRHFGIVLDEQECGQIAGVSSRQVGDGERKRPRQERPARARQSPAGP